jgi:hypothetical protein
VLGWEFEGGMYLKQFLGFLIVPIPKMCLYDILLLMFDLFRWLPLQTEHKNCGLSFYTLASLCACLCRQIILVYSLPFCVTKNTFKSMQGNDAPRPRQHNMYNFLCNVQDVAP